MGRWRRLHHDDRGNIAILAAFTLPITMLVIGGAVDYASTLNMRSKLQTAVDAALLATAEHKSSNPHLSTARLETYFARQLQGRIERRLKKLVTLKQVKFDVLPDNALLASISAEKKSHFLRLVSIDHIEIRVSAEVKSARARTEVALVLDVTGSMAGAKLKELKKAARSFLDTIAKKIPDSDPNAFRVAVVPFSQYVNVGLEYRHADWIDVPADGWRQISSGWGWGWWWWGGGARRYVRWEGCVGSRPYPLNVLDKSYVNRVPGIMNYAEYSPYGKWQLRNNCPSASILPLTSLKTNRKKIKKKIKSLQASGTTYIPAGLVWGWRVLSGQEPFPQGADDETILEHNVRKVIVLMTDGENTVSPYLDNDEGYREHTGTDTDYANDMTLEVCNNIKETNPYTGRPNAEIVTITFNVNSKVIKNLLQKCSTLGAYDVKSGQLVKVFEQVANKLTELHISR